MTEQSKNIALSDGEVLGVRRGPKLVYFSLLSGGRIALLTCTVGLRAGFPGSCVHYTKNWM